MIASHTAGRLRLREKSWQAKDFEIFADKIQNLADIENVQTNPKTKSVLIFYQPNAKTTAEKIITIAQKIKPDADSKKSPKTTKIKNESQKTGRQQAHARQRYRARINLAMLTTLGASLFALTTKNTKLHAITGFGFVGLLLLHLFEHRKKTTW